MSLTHSNGGAVQEVEIFTISTDINFATIAFQSIQIMLALGYLFSLTGQTPPKEANRRGWRASVDFSEIEDDLRQRNMS